MKYINLVVRDSGVGIDENSDKLFDFGVTGNHDNKNSHGIGLNFCKTALELLKGNIKLEQNKPNGTIATVTLPVE